MTLLQADMGRVPVLGSRAEYERMYERSLAQPAEFWSDMAKSLGLYFKQQVMPRVCALCPNCHACRACACCKMLAYAVIVRQGRSTSCASDICGKSGESTCAAECWEPLLSGAMSVPLRTLCST